ncbi:Uncharacterised protein [Lysinibacillus capsici]|uniref:Uncharacterized protein n=1 Tax=Lysinibacillus capsici TaxID=2115968 RepID=A0A2X0Z9Y4_9BACI|nr:Uncharacterised protein [Lysinibacillus capsici]
MTAPLRVLKNKALHTIFVKGEDGLPLHTLNLIKMLPFLQRLN